MKKIIFLIVLIFIISACGKVLNNDNSVPDSFLVTKSDLSVSSSSPIVFENSDDSEFWARFKNLNERFDALQVDQSQLNAKTTSALIESIYNYPLNALFFAYDYPFDFIKILFEKSTIHKEFYGRQDAASEMLNLFCETKKIDDVPFLRSGDDILVRIIASAIVPGTYSQDNLPRIRDEVERRIHLLEDGDSMSNFELIPLLVILKQLEDPISASLELAQSFYSELEQSSRLTTVSNSVFISTPLGHSLVGLHLDEFDSNTINYYNNQFRCLFPNATFLSTSTRHYNCHSYAWHDTRTVNNIWLNSVYNSSLQLSKYWSNDLYISCQESEAQKIFYSDDDHSAIVSSTSGKYVSKWGAGPLMEHDPEDCPYLASNKLYFKERPLEIVDGQLVLSGNLITITIQGDQVATVGDEHRYTCDYPGNVVWNYSTITDVSHSPSLYPTGGDCTVVFREQAGYIIKVDGYYNGIRYATGQLTVFAVDDIYNY